MTLTFSHIELVNLELRNPIEILENELNLKREVDFSVFPRPIDDIVQIHFIGIHQIESAKKLLEIYTAPPTWG